jgi:hypothetical protein
LNLLTAFEFFPPLKSLFLRSASVMAGLGRSRAASGRGEAREQAPRLSTSSTSKFLVIVFG